MSNTATPLLMLGRHIVPRELYRPVQMLLAEIEWLRAEVARRRLRGMQHTRHDVITFAIRDYAKEAVRPWLWAAADDIAALIEERLDADSLT
jgi:hypothetical protein